MAVLAVLMGFSLFVNYAKVLSLTGIITANIVGILGFLLGGIAAFATLLLFYIAGESATRIPKKSSRHEQRTHSNIIGNCAAAILSLALGSAFGFFGAISSALADTLSSEIGILSKGNPVLITTLREAEKGTDGAISPLGLAAAMIGAAAYYTYHKEGALPNYLLGGYSIIIIIAGFLGSIMDSVLGATLQARGVLDNNTVNIAANLFGAAIALGLAALA